MRAKMSPTSRPTHTQRGYAPQCHAADAALSEARAILAETEPYIAPGQEHTHSDMRLTLATRDYRAYAVASDCLADALAAFVS